MGASYQPHLQEVQLYNNKPHVKVTRGIGGNKVFADLNETAWTVAKDLILKQHNVIQLWTNCMLKGDGAV